MRNLYQYYWGYYLDFLFGFLYCVNLLLFLSEYFYICLFSCHLKEVFSSGWAVHFYLCYFCCYYFTSIAIIKKEHYEKVLFIVFFILLFTFTFLIQVTAIVFLARFFSLQEIQRNLCNNSRLYRCRRIIFFQERCFGLFIFWWGFGAPPPL